MPKTKLLIVEDYEGIVTLLRSTLDDEFDIVVARDAGEGLKAVRDHQPHVVLLDLGLPPRSSPEEGLRFLRELSRMGGRHNVIVCTGYSERSLASPNWRWKRSSPLSNRLPCLVPLNT